MSFQVRDTVGDYQIIGLLGAGGMGKVYKVKNVISDRIDAMKVLLPNLADDPDLADRFIREIKVLASLDHPNIAGLRTAFRLENQLLMIMEYVEGTTLDERTKVGRIPLEDAINYISQVLAALGYAHQRGVIHRDIKPANMMLTPGNAIKLMDFGIAKTKSDKKLTQTGTTLGSLFYMSAEQVQGSELDGRSDLYSVGVSLYELVTGTRPFQGKSDFEIMVAQLQQTPMAPIQMMPELPRALNDIIMTSLEKDPARRFQTAEAFGAALASISQLLHQTPVQASYGGAAPGYSPIPGQASATGLMASQGAPPPPSYPPAGTSVYAAGGYVPTSQQPTVVVAPAGGYTGTSAQPAVTTPPPAGYSHTPTVVSPPPPTAGPPYVPPEAGPVAAAAPRAPKGYRGLYMTLGALVALGVLVLAATQLPRILKTHAGGDQAAQTSSSQPAAGATGSAQATAPATVASANPPNSSSTAGAVSTGAEGTSVTSPAAGTGTTASTSTSATRSSANATKAQSNSSNLAAGGGQTGGQNPGTSAVTVPPLPAAANNAQDAQELTELGDLHDKLSVRAQAANEGVDAMRKQMQAGGYNLRSDIAASQTRMKMYMNKFDAAMNAGDPVAGRKYMDLAEHEVENLEKFLGH